MSEKIYGYSHDPETGEVIAHDSSGDRITTEQLRNLLALKHKTNIPEDDPMLMIGTIFNALMENAETLLEAKMTKVVQEFEKELAQRLQPITEEALKNQIHGHLAKMRESGEIVERLMQTFKNYCKWLMICGFLTCAVSIINIYLIVR